jgi:hypothetical protein
MYSALAQVQITKPSHNVVQAYRNVGGKGGWNGAGAGAGSGASKGGSKGASKGGKGHPSPPSRLFIKIGGLQQHVIQAKGFVENELAKLSFSTLEVSIIEVGSGYE